MEGITSELLSVGRGYGRRTAGPLCPGRLTEGGELVHAALGGCYFMVFSGATVALDT